MNNLFSIFDPQAILSLPWNWLFIFAALSTLPLNFWAAHSRCSTLSPSPSLFFLNEIKALIPNNSALGKPLVLVSLFWMIAALNLAGLLPFVFTPTSHLSISLALALPLWLGHMCWASGRSPHRVLAHFSPSGAPLALGPFMVLIELISSIIRPLTLSVRLAANMVAGHLLLCLLGNNFPNLKLAALIGALAALCALLVLELAVALIQAYVFAMLSSLYVEEVEAPAL